MPTAPTCSPFNYCFTSSSIKVVILLGTCHVTQCGGLCIPTDIQLSYRLLLSLHSIIVVSVYPSLINLWSRLTRTSRPNDQANEKPKDGSHLIHSALFYCHIDHTNHLLFCGGLGGNLAVITAAVKMNRINNSGKLALCSILLSYWSHKLSLILRGVRRELSSEHCSCESPENHLVPWGKFIIIF